MTESRFKSASYTDRDSLTELERVMHGLEQIGALTPDLRNTLNQVIEITNKYANLTETDPDNETLLHQAFEREMTPVLADLSDGERKIAGKVFDAVNLDRSLGQKPLTEDTLTTAIDELKSRGASDEFINNLADEIVATMNHYSDMINEVPDEEALLKQAQDEIREILRNAEAQISGLTQGADLSSDQETTEFSKPTDIPEIVDLTRESDTPDDDIHIINEPALQENSNSIASSASASRLDLDSVDQAELGAKELDRLMKEAKYYTRADARDSLREEGVKNPTDYAIETKYLSDLEDLYTTAQDVYNQYHDVYGYNDDGEAFELLAGYKKEYIDLQMQIVGLQQQQLSYEDQPAPDEPQPDVISVEAQETNIDLNIKNTAFKM